LIQALHDESLSTNDAAEHARAALERIDQQREETRKRLQELTKPEEAEHLVRSHLDEVHALDEAVGQAVDRADRRNEALARLEFVIGQWAVARKDADALRRLKRFEAVRAARRGEETRSHVELGKLAHEVRKRLTLGYELGNAPALLSKEGGEDGNVVSAFEQAAKELGCKIERGDIEQFLYDQGQASDEAKERARGASCVSAEGRRLFQQMEDFREQFHPERAGVIVSPYRSALRLREATAGEEVVLPPVGGVIESLRRDQRNKIIHLAMNTGTRGSFYVDDKGELSVLQGTTPYPDTEPLDALQGEQSIDDTHLPTSSPVRAVAYSPSDITGRLNEMGEGSTIRITVRAKDGVFQEARLTKREGQWQYEGAAPEGAPDATHVFDDPHSYDPRTIRYEFATSA
jgi:hypothetical protein